MAEVGGDGRGGGLALGIMMASTAADAAGGRRSSVLGDAFDRCLEDTEAAYWRCRRRNPGYWGTVTCSLARKQEQLACVFAVAVQTIAAREGFGATVR